MVKRLSMRRRLCYYIRVKYSFIFRPALMVNHNFLTYSGKIIFQILGEILYFPIWWYTVGLGRLVKNLWRFLLNQEASLGLSIWAKNIFVPMYGQYDWVSRIISLVMRLVQIIVRAIALIFWLLVVGVVFGLWLAIPLALLLALSFQFLN